MKSVIMPTTPRINGKVAEFGKQPAGKREIRPVSGTWNFCLARRRMLAKDLQCPAKQCLPRLHAVPRRGSGGVGKRQHLHGVASPNNIECPADAFRQLGRRQKLVARELSHGDDQLRFQYPQFGFHPFGTTLDFIRRGNPVAARRLLAGKAPAHRGEINPVARLFLIPSERLVKPAKECSPGGPRERAPHLRLLVAGCLANEVERAAHRPADHRRPVHLRAARAGGETLDMAPQRGGRTKGHRLRYSVANRLGCQRKNRGWTRRHVAAWIRFVTVSEHLTVVCALIESGGRVLVAQRKLGTRLGGRWEFPGGKIHDGESAQAAIVREIHEELGAVIVATGALTPVTHDYGDFSLTLIPFTCAIVSGVPVALEHEAIDWLEPGKLASIDWAAADLPIAAEYLATVNSKGSGE